MTTQAPVSYAIGRYLGLPGSITRYFWVQAIYPSGRSIVSNLVQVDNAGSLTSQNQINIQWAPAPGAIGYDVVETPTSSAPTLNATATIGVALGLTDSNLTLSAEPTLVSWTYSTGNGTVGSDITIGTTQIASGTDGRVLYQAAGLVAESADLTWDATTGLAVGKPIVGSGKITGDSVSTTAKTVATLPATPTAGQRSFVTDSNAASFTAGIGAVVAAGGSTAVPVVYDGTNWRIG